TGSRMPPALRAARSLARCLRSNVQAAKGCDSEAAYRRSVENRHAAGEPIDVDVVLAGARSESDAAAVGPAVGEESDRTHLLADDVALRREELHVHLARQCMHARRPLDLERPCFEIQHHAGFLPA